MADLYRSTNKLQDNPYPERSHLLTEGIIDIDPSTYYAVTGGYMSSGSLEISAFIKIGDREKGFSPEMVECKAWKTEKRVTLGQTNDIFKPVPFTTFDNFSTGQVKEWAEIFVGTQYLDAGPPALILMSIDHFISVLPTRTQSFSYKIYNTIYKFTDT